MCDGTSTTQARSSTITLSFMSSPLLHSKLYAELEPTPVRLLRPLTPSLSPQGGGGVGSLTHFMERTRFSAGSRLLPPSPAPAGSRSPCRRPDLYPYIWPAGCAPCRASGVDPRPRVYAARRCPVPWPSADRPRSPRDRDVCACR